MIPNLKRPYPDEEGVSSAHPPASVKRRQLISISEAVGANPASAGLLWTTASISRYNAHDTYRNYITGAHEPYPVPWASSSSPGDALEVPSSAGSAWTPATSTSISEELDIRNESNEIEICFGMLVDGLLSAWKSSPISKLSSSRQAAPTLKPRFRDNGITILNPDKQEIGVLDKRTSSGMVSLKNTASLVQFELYVTPGTKQVQSLDGTLGLPLEILVFGQRNSLGQVGSLLSQSGLFLQEPMNHQLSVPYRNPRVFSWDEEDDANSSYLLEPSSESQIDFTDKIHDVLNNTSVPQLSFPVTQDARITSILKQHQLIALKFIIA